MSPTGLFSTTNRATKIALPSGPWSLGSAHLVGICGAGMKALAELLRDCGTRVTGSDRVPNSTVVQHLQSLGIGVQPGHAAQHLDLQPDLVIYSPAIDADNPERARARELGIPTVSYNEMLGLLMDERTGVAVAGTHGKSTTTALAGTLLSETGAQPSVIVGAELAGRARSGWAGAGGAFVVESCEYRESFLSLRPRVGAILSVEEDHFDCFADLAALENAFSTFAGQVAHDGVLVIPAECPRVARITNDAACRVETFGCAASADWRAVDFKRTPVGTRFRVVSRELGEAEAEIRLPGRHNVLNALAAVALATRSGADFTAVARAVSGFWGIRRRFEIVGEAGGVVYLDDYAHHPTEIRATLAAVRERFGTRRLICGFQPHQISRTICLMGEFAASFEDADQVFVVPAFAAREAGGQATIDVSRELVDRIAEGGIDAEFVPSLDQLTATLDDESRSGDVVVTMGAGDIDRIQYEFTRRFQRDS